ncbi:MAG: hypothetical protein D3904_02415 [Candidatus Electrothrix sp. EH2]|nr:hypothetical protein [Candidatus Electrothrix sp. EH2]
MLVACIELFCFGEKGVIEKELKKGSSMISKVKWKTKISCVPDYLSAFFQHGVRSSAACGGEPADIRSRKGLSTTGRACFYKVCF